MTARLGQVVAAGAALALIALAIRTAGGGHASGSDAHAPASAGSPVRPGTEPRPQVAGTTEASGALVELDGIREGFPTVEAAEVMAAPHRARGGLRIESILCFGGTPAAIAAEQVADSLRLQGWDRVSVAPYPHQALRYQVNGVRDDVEVSASVRKRRIAGCDSDQGDTWVEIGIAAGNSRPARSTGSSPASGSAPSIGS